MINKLYIGIDPDLEKLNAAVITDDKEVLAVFIRRNKSKFSDDKKVADAARCACALADDVINFILTIRDRLSPTCTVSTIVESQNIQHALSARKKNPKRKIDPDDIRRLAQVAGQLMGAFGNVSDKLSLVQPINWKGTINKAIAHPRYYGHLNLTPDPERRVAALYPINMAEICQYSQEKINMGDFEDINDSLGLALYGAKKGL